MNTRFFSFLAFAALIASSAAAQVFPVRAEVRSIDADGLGFVAAHEAIPGFMEAMVMPFAVRDAEQLARLQVGDKVAFDYVVDESGSFASGLRALPSETLLKLPSGLRAHRHVSAARAPAGVMGDHLHHAGASMVSVRQMEMRMDGIFEGSSKLSAADVFDRGYRVAPESMRMKMTMLGAMYAPTNDVTFTAMAHYRVSEMAGVNRMGSRFATRSEGWGDATLGALFRIGKSDASPFHAGLSLGIPLGSIDAEDANGPMVNKRLPYAMQPGSGTYDLRPSLTWLGGGGPWAWGGQANGIFRLGRNAAGYRLGDRAGGSFWVSRRAGEFRFSSRLSAERWGTIAGRDEGLDPMAAFMNAGADPDKQGGVAVEAHVGLDWSGDFGPIGPVRLALEYGRPLYQDLDGPQMGRESMLTTTFNTRF